MVTRCMVTLQNEGREIIVRDDELNKSRTGLTCVTFLGILCVLTAF